jgi:hypothetical protein
MNVSHLIIGIKTESPIKTVRMIGLNNVQSFHQKLINTSATDPSIEAYAVRKSQKLLHMLQHCSMLIQSKQHKVSYFSNLESLGARTLLHFQLNECLPLNTWTTNLVTNQISQNERTKPMFSSFIRN